MKFCLIIYPNMIEFQHYDFRLSNLHLIDWKFLVVDLNVQTVIKSGNLKGSAVKLITAERKLGSYQVEQGGIQSVQVADQRYVLRDMMSCGREVSAVSEILYDASDI